MDLFYVLCPMQGWRAAWSQGGVSRRNGRGKTHRLSPYISRQVGVRRTCTCAEEGGKWRLNGADDEWHCWGWMEERWRLVGKK